MDRGAWWTMVFGVTKSQTGLSTQSHTLKCTWKPTLDLSRDHRCYILLKSYRIWCQEDLGHDGMMLHHCG